MCAAYERRVLALAVEPALKVLVDHDLRRFDVTAAGGVEDRLVQRFARLALGREATLKVCRRFPLGSGGSSCT